jgi:hypothetical protein
MNRLLILVPAALFGIALCVPCFAQCGFAIVPAADTHWYREQGWPIPGLDDAKGFAKIHLTVDGKPEQLPLPDGVTVAWVVHGDDYYVRFPDAVFDQNGSPMRMLARSFKLYEMLRWEMNGTPYAYSYELGPLDIACSATVDIIDDRGDGKFRLMTSPGHPMIGPASSGYEPPPVPAWLQKPKS